MNRYFYSNSIVDFLKASQDAIIGALTRTNEFTLEQTQLEAWNQEIQVLKEVLKDYRGFLFFEYSIPRMGRRIDVVLIIDHVIFVCEFKVGEKSYPPYAIEQVWDYALDLKNFHQTSHHTFIAPILISTEAKSSFIEILATSHNDKVLRPIKVNADTLDVAIRKVLQSTTGETIDVENWMAGRYSPTPTIIEAATALYGGHSVAEISRSDASAVNLTKTSEALTQIILDSRRNKKKSICFVTGVPGAGKTLVGLDVANKKIADEKLTSVFLSGNGPLVAILREALTRDKVEREKRMKKKVTKGKVMSEIKAVIQNVHHFRDEYLKDDRAPFDHVTIFDEAQRAWDHAQTASFMKSKKRFNNFLHSEPEFLISCLNRHEDWAVIICLVGGGQEINKGEAGISEWIDSLNRSFPDWHVYVSNRLTDSEYAAGNALQVLKGHRNVFQKEELHLSVSLRSFRAEHLSRLVKTVLDLDMDEAQKNYQLVKEKYPIVITRDLIKAKTWLREKARGSERYGLVASSKAQRLKPHAIDVKSPMNPINWFLEGKNDVRSSFYLEDAATEFHVQGLELDWTCVTWDADFRFVEGRWETFSFSGTKWKKVQKEDKKQYLKNAYRVLLTRARQGMVIFVPEGDVLDATRPAKYYDQTFSYLSKIGFQTL